MEISKELEATLKSRERIERMKVRELGSLIGYGRMMQLAEQLWREMLSKQYGGLEGGEHSVGPCAALLVPCPCIQEPGVACDWCCGAGRVTKRVLQAMTEEE